MIWPGMGDPTKRKKILRFLLITAGIGISVGLASSLIQGQLSVDDPLKACINNRDTQYKIKATLELYVNNLKAEIPANIGFSEGQCQRSLYTVSDDGTIYAEWEEAYPFELGHFLWSWDFPIRDIDQSKSKIIVNGAESPLYIRVPLEDGYHYRAEFIEKGHEKLEGNDFLPPESTP